MPALTRVSQPAQLTNVPRTTTNGTGSEATLPGGVKPLKKRARLSTFVEGGEWLDLQQEKNKKKERWSKASSRTLHPPRWWLTSRLTLTCSRRALTILQKYSHLFKNMCNKLFIGTVISRHEIDKVMKCTLTEPFPCLRVYRSTVCLVVRYKTARITAQYGSTEIHP